MQFQKLLKDFQRRIYTFLNTTFGFTTAIVAAFILAFLIFQTPENAPSQVQNNNSDICGDSVGCPGFWTVNIGGIDARKYSLYEPIDAVYTWVNGSDSEWLKKKEYWASKEAHLHLNSNNQSLTFQNHTKGNSTEEGDDTNTLNRYRDNEELRYSLRSLIKNAPWIRKIYIVTDHQVPYWLNLDNGGRLQVVHHEEIFANHSNLPVFSSPAIESQLHHIPGLSKKFIYFNDDVFLGSPVYPDDFVSLSGVQQLYLSWDVPKCAPGCTDSWIGDGICDLACNVSSCNFDYPDCVNSTTRTGTSTQSYSCSEGCPDSWLADKVCDRKCKNDACGWDLGDCGIDLIVESYEGVEITTNNALILHVPKSIILEGYASNNLSTALELGKASETKPMVISITVPFGTKAVYYNTTNLPCLSSLGWEVGNLCNSDQMEAFEYESAEFEDLDSTGTMIHTAALLKRHHMLVVMLHHGETLGPSNPISFPQKLRVSICGSSKLTNMTTIVHVYIEVWGSNNDSMVPLVPVDMSEVPGYATECSPSQGIWTNKSPPQLSNIPFRMNLDYGILEGVRVHLTLSDLPLRTTGTHKISDYSVFTVFDESPLHDRTGSGVTEVLETPLCSSIGQIVNQNGTKMILPRFTSDECDNDITWLQQHLRRDQTRGDEIADQLSLSLLITPRLHWSALQAHSRWIHTKTVIARHVTPMKWGNQNWTTLSCPNSSYVEAGHNSSGMPTCDIPQLVHSTFPEFSSHDRLSCFLSAFRWGSVQDSTVMQNESSNSISVNVSSIVNTTELLSHESIQLNVTTSRRLASLGSVGRVVSIPILDESHPKKELQSIVDTPPYGPPTNRRRLVDTYAQSLIHVNRLYSKAFGNDNRKVPAHMPHMIDRDMMESMQSRWPKQWADTAGHRFRSSQDMQYSFSYYYALIHNHLAQDRLKETEDYIRDKVDVNKDGFVDDNELRSLAAMVYYKSPTAEHLTELKSECVLSTRNSPLKDSMPAQTSPDIDYQERSSQSVPFGRIQRGFSLRLFPRVHELANCSIVIQGLYKNVVWSRYRPTHNLGVESEIAFEMISDNYTETMDKLDSIRQRQSKFVCVNDNMQDPSLELVTALRDFYESFFPKPSVFELPPGVRNNHDSHSKHPSQGHTIDSQSGHRTDTWWQKVFRSSWGVRLLDLLSDQFADKDMEDNVEESIIHLRQEIQRSQTEFAALKLRRRSHGIRTFFGFWTVCLSIIGLVGICCLRMASRSSRTVNEDTAQRHEFSGMSKSANSDDHSVKGPNNNAKSFAKLHDDEKMHYIKHLHHSNASDVSVDKSIALETHIDNSHRTNMDSPSSSPSSTPSVVVTPPIQASSAPPPPPPSSSPSAPTSSPREESKKTPYYPGKMLYTAYKSMSSKTPNTNTASNNSGSNYPAASKNA